MKDKLNILLLDCYKDRRDSTESFIRCCDEGSYCIDSKSSIDQYSYENNNYDIVFAHYGNKEVEESIRDSDWNSGKAVIIYFSGEFRKDRKYLNGKWYVSASFIEKRKNICMLLKDIIKI